MIRVHSRLRVQFLECFCPLYASVQFYMLSFKQPSQHGSLVFCKSKQTKEERNLRKFKSFHSSPCSVFTCICCFSPCGRVCRCHGNSSKVMVFPTSGEVPLFCALVLSRVGGARLALLCPTEADFDARAVQRRSLTFDLF